MNSAKLRPSLVSWTMEDTSSSSDAAKREELSYVFQPLTPTQLFQCPTEDATGRSTSPTDPSTENTITGFTILPVSQLNLDELGTGGRCFRCPVCAREVKERTDFIRHYMTHTGEKPFWCQLCSYKASRKYTLMRHLKTVHTELFGSLKCPPSSQAM